MPIYLTPGAYGLTHNGTPSARNRTLLLGIAGEFGEDSAMEMGLGSFQQLLPKVSILKLQGRSLLD
ncbi:MAG: hypothetical protein BRC48_07960 [Cyanobacteria bacterium QS_9_48_30]|nr:MAG: hypothetical protein BRC48_07960 [Cyanobacteria bacterium QS_9_48_30]